MKPVLGEDSMMARVSEKGMFNPTRMFNACHVANELVNQRTRQDKFQRRRRQCMEVEVQKNEILKQKHEASDKCVRLRQRELLERQNLKTVVAQHRRGEQQKMLHEVHKSQDYEFEKLQRKSQRKAKPHPEPEASSSASGRPNTSPATSAPRDQSSGSTSEKVYRDSLESHKLYEGTLSGWRSFVMENEKRTEAYWNKRLEDPDGRMKRLRQRSKTNIQMCRFRKSVDNLTTMRKFLSTTSKGNMELLEGKDRLSRQTTPEPPEWQVEGLDGLSSPGVSQELTSSFMSRSPQSDVYAARLVRVKSHHLELEEKAQQKFRKDQEFLEEKRRKGKDEMSKRAGKIKEYNTAWEQRNDSYSRRREELNQSDDTEMVEKSLFASSMHLEKQAKRDEDLTMLTASKQWKAQTTKEAADDILRQTTEGFKAKIQKQDEQNASFKEVRLKTAEARADSGIAERVDEMRAQKAANEQAFMTQTTDDIERKQKRNERGKFLNVKPQSPMESFERYRILRQENGCPRTRATPPELMLKPGHFMPQDFSELSVDEFCMEDAGSPRYSSPRTPSAADPTASSKQSRAERRSSRLQSSPSRLQLQNDTPGAPLGSPDLEARRGGVDSRHSSSVFSDLAVEEAPSSPHGEVEFLEDLRTRSQKWLDKMRHDPSDD